MCFEKCPFGYEQGGKECETCHIVFDEDGEIIDDDIGELVEEAPYRCPDCDSSSPQESMEDGSICDTCNGMGWLKN